MKIYGIGTDIVSVHRIKKFLKNKKFQERLFSKEESLKCSKLIKSNNCYAKRFAAKEAFSKALGTGISDGINFNEIIDYLWNVKDMSYNRDIFISISRSKIWTKKDTNKKWG